MKNKAKKMIKVGKRGYALIGGHIEEVEVISIDASGYKTCRRIEKGGEYLIQNIYLSLEEVVIEQLNDTNTRYGTAFGLRYERDAKVVSRALRKVNKEHQAELEILQDKIWELESREEEWRNTFSIITPAEYSALTGFTISMISALTEHGMLKGGLFDGVFYIDLHASEDFGSIMIEDISLFSNRTVNAIAKHCPTLAKLALCYFTELPKLSGLAGVGEAVLTEIEAALAYYGFLDAQNIEIDSLTILPGKKGYDINAIPVLPKRPPKEKPRTKKRIFFELIDEVVFMYETRKYDDQQVVDFLKKYRRLEMDANYAKSLYEQYKEKGNPFAQEHDMKETA